MKIDRLIAIIMVLLDREKVSAPKLAEMFEVSTRTIYRDIDTIQLAGVPIVSYSGVNGGISILPNYKMDKKVFTEFDISTLLVGLTSVAPVLSDKKIAYTLAKLRSFIPKDRSKQIELKSHQIVVDLTRWTESGEDNQTHHNITIDNHENSDFEIIKAAINEHRSIQFYYVDSSARESMRNVEPYQLVMKEGNWYLQGYCLSRQDFRIFKMNRLIRLTVTDEPFVPRAFDFKLPKVSDNLKNRFINIKLKVTAKVKQQLFENYAVQHATQQGNEFIVDFPFLDDDRGYNLLLSFGEQCECLAPAHVRQQLIARISRLMARYQS